jgi:hypothetical protein
MTEVATQEFTWVKAIADAANDVWDEIGYDYLIGCQGDPADQTPDHSTAIPREQVIEAVCDADRLNEQLGVYVRHGDVDAKVVDAWKALPYYAREEFLKRNVFKSEWYGF